MLNQWDAFPQSQLAVCDAHSLNHITVFVNVQHIYNSVHTAAMFQLRFTVLTSLSSLSAQQKDYLQVMHPYCALQSRVCML